MRFSETLRRMDGGEVLLAAAELLRLLDGEGAAAAVPDLQGDAAMVRAGAAPDFGADTALRAMARADALAAAAARGFGADGAGPVFPAMADAGDDGERRRLSEALEAVSGARRRTFNPTAETRPEDRAGNAAGTVTADAGCGDGDAVSRSAGSGWAPREGASAGPETDMDAVSEFFRRDSRRYDSGFGG